MEDGQSRDCRGALSSASILLVLFIVGVRPAVPVSAEFAVLSQHAGLITSLPLRAMSLATATLAISRQDMPHSAAGMDGEVVATMAPALALVPKFSGSNISLLEWEERLESAMCLYQVTTRLSAELAINSLVDDAHQAVMVLLKDKGVSLEQIMAWLEGLFGENVTLNEFRCRFFISRQQEDECLTQFDVALQKL